MTDEEKIPDWQLERFVLGELPEAETRAVREALARDPRLGERIGRLEQSNAAILAERPAREVVASIRELVSVPPVGSPRRFPTWTIAAGMVVVAVIGTQLAPFPPAERANPDVTRVKGGGAARLLLYRKGSSENAEPLEQGSVARARDVVQIAYQVAAQRYGAIVSIDGRGNVTSHLPRTGDQAAPLAFGAPVPLPEAYELDDAPAFERFYLVTAPEPFPVGTVLAAVRGQANGTGPGPATARLELPSRFDQSSFVLRKEDAR